MGMNVTNEFCGIPLGGVIIMKEKIAIDLRLQANPHEFPHNLFLYKKIISALQSSGC